MLGESKSYCEIIANEILRMIKANQLRFYYNLG